MVATVLGPDEIPRIHNNTWVVILIENISLSGGERTTFQHWWKGRLNLLQETKLMSIVQINLNASASCIMTLLLKLLQSKQVRTYISCNIIPEPCVEPFVPS